MLHCPSSSWLFDRDQRHVSIALIDDLAMNWNCLHPVQSLRQVLSDLTREREREEMRVQCSVFIPVALGRASGLALVRCRCSCLDRTRLECVSDVQHRHLPFSRWPTSTTHRYLVFVFQTRISALLLLICRNHSLPSASPHERRENQSASADMGDTQGDNQCGTTSSQLTLWHTWKPLDPWKSVAW